MTTTEVIILGFLASYFVVMCIDIWHHWDRRR